MKTPDFLSRIQISYSGILISYRKRWIYNKIQSSLLVKILSSAITGAIAQVR